ncbi:MAG: HAMP domain-containing histidine kinase [Lachnospiraceae bacterium]|nr:HAMP domain-containing histidine kinase [Lachnospiraceae bacterium]
MQLFEKLKNITFRTRLILLSVAMVLVPIIFTGLSFFLVIKFIKGTENFQIETVLADHEIAQIFMIDMVTCIVAILLITVIVMHRLLRIWFVQPLSELKEAMGNIADGNLDYQLKSEHTAEMGELFHHYEEMRLRLKESAEESIENEQKSRELVTNISHDLKTPITSIRGYVEGIIDGVADTPEKMDKYIRTIYNKSNELNSLINELTLYSSIDQNRIPYNFRPVNVSEFFKDCVEEIGLEMESQNIRLNYSCGVTHGTLIIADPEQLRRVINNIVSNSVKYRKYRDDHIDIRIMDWKEFVKIEIEDNGIGIGKDELPHIFERFYRTDTSRSSTGGSGIGLSIVKKIVEDHDAKIWATSKEGKGTCMHFMIHKHLYRESSEQKPVLREA